MKRLIFASENAENGIILYRDSVVDPLRMKNSTYGVFFTTNSDYFVDHPYINFTGDTYRYLLLPSANIWDPAAEFELFKPEGWDKILCLSSDLDRFGLYDECDWELDDHYGITSTDGLGFAGKRFGYDAVVIRNVYYNHGRFDEYIVYNFNVLKPL